MRQIGFIFLLIAAAFLPAPAVASIIKKPPVKSAEVSYKDLLCTEDHKTWIHELISTMAETNLVALYFKENHLKALGDRISEVHPLKFLAVIFSNPYLKSCMNVIWDSNIKRGEFLEGLGGSLSREMEKGKLHMHVEPFGADLTIPHETLRPFFDAQDWGNLVLFLMRS